MRLFYHEILNPDSGTIQLPAEESRHIVKVLRKHEGDEITMTDGKGGKYRGLIRSADRRNCMVEIREYRLMPPEREYAVHLAVSPTKNIDRFEWFLEKAVELGIDEITPLITRYSERKVIKSERALKIMSTAMKQSLRYYLPVLNPVTELDSFLRKETGYMKFIAVCHEHTHGELFENVRKNTDICVMIGPEGGFSESEIARAREAGYKPVSLGNKRLRTETAALSAVQAIHLKQRV